MLSLQHIEVIKQQSPPCSNPMDINLLDSKIIIFIGLLNKQFVTWFKMAEQGPSQKKAKSMP